MFVLEGKIGNFTNCNFAYIRQISDDGKKKDFDVYSYCEFFFLSS